jgi:hypothetical protein
MSDDHSWVIIPVPDLTQFLAVPISPAGVSCSGLGEVPQPWRVKSPDGVTKEGELGGRAFWKHLSAAEHPAQAPHTHLCGDAESKGEAGKARCKPRLSGCSPLPHLGPFWLKQQENTKQTRG